MSRPTEFCMQMAINMTPTPQAYMPQVTCEGRTLLDNKPKVGELVRGTFSQDDRFRDYNYNAYIRSNPQVGPGSHKDDEQFNNLKKKGCKVVMAPQFYMSNAKLSDLSNSSGRRSSRSNRSRGSSQRARTIDSAGSRKSLKDKLKQNNVEVINSQTYDKARFQQRISKITKQVRPNSVTRKSRSRSQKKIDSINVVNKGPNVQNSDEHNYVRTGYLLQKSPMKNSPDLRLNYDIYKQDSMNHRDHLLDIIKKKNLKNSSQSKSKPKKHQMAVSFKQSGSQGFKVGYSGKIQDLYAQNPNTKLNEVQEEKVYQRSRKRQNMYKAIFGPGEYGAKKRSTSDLKREQFNLSQGRMQRLNEEIDAQLMQPQVPSRTHLNQMGVNTQQQDHHLDSLTDNRIEQPNKMNTLDHQEQEDIDISPIAEDQMETFNEVGQDQEQQMAMQYQHYQQKEVHQQKQQNSNNQTFQTSSVGRGDHFATKTNTQFNPQGASSINTIRSSQASNMYQPILSTQRRPLIHPSGEKPPILKSRPKSAKNRTQFVQRNQIRPPSGYVNQKMRSKAGDTESNLQFILEEDDNINGLTVESNENLQSHQQSPKRVGKRLMSAKVRDDKNKLANVYPGIVSNQNFIGGKQFNHPQVLQTRQRPISSKVNRFPGHNTSKLGAALMSMQPSVNSYHTVQSQELLYHRRQTSGHAQDPSSIEDIGILTSHMSGSTAAKNYQFSQMQNQHDRQVVKQTQFKSPDNQAVSRFNSNASNSKKRLSIDNVAKQMQLKAEKKQYKVTGVKSNTMNKRMKSHQKRQTYSSANHREGLQSGATTNIDTHTENVQYQMPLNQIMTPSAEMNPTTLSAFKSQTTTELLHSQQYPRPQQNNFTHKKNSIKGQTSAGLSNQVRNIKQDYLKTSRQQLNLHLSMAQIYDPCSNPVIIYKTRPLKKRKRRILQNKPPRGGAEIKDDQDQFQYVNHEEQYLNQEAEDQTLEQQSYQVLYQQQNDEDIDCMDPETEERVGPMNKEASQQNRDTLDALHSIDAVRPTTQQEGEVEESQQEHQKMEGLSEVPNNQFADLQSLPDAQRTIKTQDEEIQQVVEQREQRSSDINKMPTSTIGHQQQDFIINQDDPLVLDNGMKSISTGQGLEAQRQVFQREQENAHASINFTDQHNSIDQKNLFAMEVKSPQETSQDQKVSIDAYSPGKVTYNNAESSSKGEIQTTIVTSQPVQNRINLQQVEQATSPIPTSDRKQIPAHLTPQENHSEERGQKNSERVNNKKMSIKKEQTNTQETPEPTDRLNEEDHLRASNEAGGFIIENSNERSSANKELSEINRVAATNQLEEINQNLVEFTTNEPRDNQQTIREESKQEFDEDQRDYQSSQPDLSSQNIVQGQNNINKRYSDQEVEEEKDTINKDEFEHLYIEPQVQTNQENKTERNKIITGSQELRQNINDELIEPPNPISQRAHNAKNIVIQNVDDNGGTQSSMKFQHTENSDNLAQMRNSIKIDESTTTKMIPEYQQHIVVNEERDSIGPYEQERLITETFQKTISQKDMALSSLQMGLLNSQSEIKTIIKEPTTKAPKLNLYQRKQTGDAQKDLVIGYEEEKVVGQKSKDLSSSTHNQIVEAQRQLKKPEKVSDNGDSTHRSVYEDKKKQYQGPSTKVYLEEDFDPVSSPEGHPNHQKKKLPPDVKDNKQYLSSIDTQGARVTHIMQGVRQPTEGAQQSVTSLFNSESQQSQKLQI